MKGVIKSCRATPRDQWEKVWKRHVKQPEDETDGFAALFEAAMSSSIANDTVLAARIVVELGSGGAVQMKPIGDALEKTAGKLELLVEGNEDAWHLHSEVLAHLFPKTSSSSWGFSLRGWNWTTWWNMVTKVLTVPVHDRSADILILVLVMIQEESNTEIKQMQVWREYHRIAKYDRIAKVRKILCDWVEFDDVTLAETLQPYGVDI